MRLTRARPVRTSIRRRLFSQTWHNGRTGAFCAFLGFLPSSDAAVVILCNTPATVDQGGRKLLKALGKKKAEK
ncbi:MAG: hypothetical protein WC712_05805 [Candidatus Brocadiia bacterium]